MPKNRTWQNPWLDALQHPPASGWHRVRKDGDEFMAFCNSSARWLKADYGTNGVRYLGRFVDPEGLEYWPDGR